MTTPLAVVAETYFDGERHFPAGPYTVLVEGGVIAGISQGDFSEALTRRGVQVTMAGFLMPGLVDAHCHLFLDGAVLDGEARSRHLDLPLDALAETARRNARKAAACGVTLLRDAGDRFGVNHRLRAEAADPGSGLPAIRSAGLGVKRPGRYGSFIATDVGDRAEIVATVKRLAAASDDIKIVLTGIVDFAKGAVTDEPQFSIDEAALIAQTAREAGRRSFAHCSGENGLAVAVAAGFDSVEHGYFISREILAVMANKGMAWTPTFSPVHFQCARPEMAGWPTATVANLRRILDQHAVHLRLAEQVGVTILIGTDAGSMGVEHGVSVVDEIHRFLDAGLRLESALRSATSAPRRHWGARSLLLEKGQVFDAVLLEASPFDRPDNLRRVKAVFRAGTRLTM